MVRSAVLGLLVAALCGCGYRAGFVVRGDVRGVAVPVFANDTFYRNIEIDLTQAVITRIQKETPYRISDSTRAEAVLEGRIVNYRLAVLQEDEHDMPTESEIIMAVEVTLTGADGEVMFKGIVRDGDSFSTAAGETELSARKELFRRMAQQIVEKAFEPEW